MNNSNILSQISKKASQLYKKFFFKGREFWQEAMRKAAKLVKAIKDGVVTFRKQENKDGICEITTRRIATLESIGYQSKTQKEPNGLIKLVDLDKYEAKLPSFIISFYPCQLV